MEDVEHGSAAGASAARFTAHRLGPDAAIFEGTVIPPHPGRYSIEAVQEVASPPGRPPSVPIRVERPDLEGRHPEADHEVLARIAEATGGRVLALDRLDEGFAGVPDRGLRIPDDLTEQVWDSKLALILFGLVITVEWTLRKAFGLL